MREEVDAVLDYRTSRKRRMYLVKWRHLDELTWEPEESIPKSAADKVYGLHKLKGEFAKKRVFEHLRKEPVKALKVSRSRSPERRGGSDYGESSSEESDRDASKGPEASAVQPAGQFVIPKGRTGGLVMELDEVKLDAINRLLHVSDPRRIQPVLAGVAAELNSLFSELSSTDTIANKICQLLWVSALSIYSDEDATKAELLELLVRLARQLYLKTATAEHTFIDFLKREYNAPDSNVQILTGDGYSLILSLNDLLVQAKGSSAPTEMSVDPTSAKPSALPSPAASSVGAAGEFGTAEWRRLIYKVYELRNPEKLGDLPDILRKYPHGLPTLFETVCRKYQLDPQALANKMFPALSFELAADRQSRARKELLSIFASFDSARLQEVDSLLAMNAGRELALIEAERKKYVHELHVAADAPESEFSPLVRQALAVANFEKLFDVPRLLTKYKGREHYLYLAICEKYSLPVDEASFRAAESAAQAASQDRKDTRVREVIEDVYRRFNPAKLLDVPRLVEKYRGSERELLEQVCEKYGVPVKEKLMMICSIDECADDAALHQRLQQLLRHFKLPNSLWQLLLLEISTWAVSQAVSADHLRLLLPPRISGLGAARGEVLLRGLLVHGGSEKDFTETLRHRILPLLNGDVQAVITEQEPEYVAWDCFLATEQLRGATLVTITGSAEAVSEAVRQVCEFVTSISETRDELESANLKCSAQLSLDDGSERVFIGKEMACTFRPLADAPSPARARLSVWTSLSDESLNRVCAAAGGVTRWFRQVVTIVDFAKKQVAVIGESQHRTAFKHACAEVEKMTETEPDVAGLKIPKFLLEVNAQQLLAPQIADFSDDEGAYFESGDDLESEADNPSELVRPIRLTRASMRDLFTRGLVCLNCDSGNHKHTECTLKRKVCWNCHSIHSGTVCSKRCRFCKQKHAYAILDCVKRAAKRYSDWRKSKVCLDQRTTSALLDDLHLRLQANAAAGREIHDVTNLMRKLRELGTTADLLAAVGDGVSENVEVADDNARESAREFLAENVPQPPSISPPPLPDPHYRWTEIFYLDDLLGHALIGRDVLRLLQTTRATQLKDLEEELDCMIEFRGGAFTELSGEDEQNIEERDLRLHAIIKCSSHSEAALARNALVELMSQLELSMADPTWQQRPPLTQAFTFLDKVNLPTEQNDRYGSSTVDVELKERESETGALRHWLHSQGIEVEVDDELSMVKLPPTLDILAKLEAQSAEDDVKHDDPRAVAVGADLYFAFVAMLSNWINPAPCAATGYWFEAYELEPLGLLGLMGQQESDRVFLEPGQRVKLSKRGAADLLSLLRQGEMIPKDVSDEEGLKLLLTFTGLVRAAASDFKLLLYLRYPWVLSGATLNDIDDLVSPLPEAEVARLLRDCGRLGTMREPVEFLVPGRSWAEDPEAEGAPGDALLRRLADDRVPEGELPYLGYIVDWQPPKFLEREAKYASAPALLPEAPTPSVSEVVLSADDASPVHRIGQKVDDLLQLNITTLRDKLKSQSLPQTGNKRDLAERLVQASTASTAPAVSKLHRCRFELPKELMVWSELQNNITGSRDAHLLHITSQCPSVTVTCHGTASAVLVGEARLHVQISSMDESEYRKARGLVEDLLKAVVEVGAEVCFPDNDQMRSQLIRDIRVVILAGEREEPKPAASFSSLLGALAAARAQKK